MFRVPTIYVYTTGPANTTIKPFQHSWAKWDSRDSQNNQSSQNIKIIEIETQMLRGDFFQLCESLDTFKTRKNQVEESLKWKEKHTGQQTKVWIYGYID